MVLPAASANLHMLMCSVGGKVALSHITLAMANMFMVCQKRWMCIPLPPSLHRIMQSKPDAPDRLQPQNISMHGKPIMRCGDIRLTGHYQCTK